MGKTKKVKEKKGRIMIDDHVLLSDISDYEYDTLVEKPQSIGTCNNFEKSSSLCFGNVSFLRIIMFYILLFLYMTKGALVFVLPV